MPAQLFICLVRAISFDPPKPKKLRDSKRTKTNGHCRPLVQMWVIGQGRRNWLGRGPDFSSLSGTPSTESGNPAVSVSAWVSEA
jgi:hypothetical protein